MSLFELTTEIKRKESELSQLKESLKVVEEKYCSQTTTIKKC